MKTQIKKILSFAIGPVGAAIIGFITLPTLTWFFSPEDIGRYSLLNVVISLGVLVVCLGLDQSYAREYYEVNNEKLLRFRTFAPGLLISIIFVFFGFFDVERLTSFIFDYADQKLYFSLVLLIFFGLINRYYSLRFRMDGLGLSYSSSILIQKLVFLIIILSYVSVSSIEPSFVNIYQAFFFSFFVSTLFNSLLFFIVIKRKVKYFDIEERSDVPTYGKLLSYGLPLMVGAISFWFLTASDRLILKYYSSLEELAVYSVAVSFSMAASLIQTIFSTMWGPYVFKNIKFDIDINTYNSLQSIRNFSVIVFMLIVSISGSLSWIIDYFLPSTYSDVKYLVVLCILTPLFTLITDIVSVGISIAKKTKYILFSSIICCSLNVILNLLLIPSYGATGAAISTSISMFFYMFLRLLFSNFVWVKFNILNNITPLFATFLIVAVFSFGKDSFDNRIFPALFGLSTILLIVLFILKLKEVKGYYVK